MNNKFVTIKTLDANSMVLTQYHGREKVDWALMSDKIMTEIWTYIDGVKVNIPQDPYDASELGWHKGAELLRWLPGLSSVEHVLIRDNAIIAWCHDTVDRRTYRVFSDSIWFHHEADALLCMLRWL